MLCKIRLEIIYDYPFCVIFRKDKAVYIVFFKSHSHRPKKIVLFALVKALPVKLMKKLFISS